MNYMKKRLGVLSMLTMMGLACLAPQTVCAEETPYNPQATQEQNIQNTEEPAQAAQNQTTENQMAQTVQNQTTENQTAQTAEPVATIRLNRAKKSLERGDTIKLRARIRNSSTKKIIWRSSKKRVASVDKKGVVTAKDKGKTTITARIKGTNISAKCVIVVKKYITMWVKTTGYCNCASCAGQWAGAATASGTRPKENRTIAVDKRLIPLGTKVRIGDETYVAEDTGGAIKGRKIDVYYGSHGRAMAHGVKYQKIKVYI